MATRVVRASEPPCLKRRFSFFLPLRRLARRAPIRGARSHGDPMILGLSLVQRAALAARRAGYRRGSARRRRGRRDARGRPVADWRRTRRAPAARRERRRWSSRPRRSSRKPIGSNGWLRHGARSRPLGSDPDRIVMLAAGFGAGCAANARRGARRPRRGRGRLARYFGPPSALSAEIDPMVVEGPGGSSASPSSGLLR